MPVFVALSSNLDDPPLRLLEALGALRDHPRMTLRAASSLYQTKPWGYLDQPDFCNGACRIETDLAPRELLEALQGLEKQLGRVPPPVRWGPRRIDLDLLLYEDQVIDEPDLKVPHGLIRQRAFVLVPLLEIAPALRDPITGRPYAEDLERIERQDGDVVKVRKVRDIL